MFKNSYQNGLLSIFYSCGANPLAIWDTEVNNGHIKRLTDSEVNSVVLEIVSTNVTTTYMTCPAKQNQVLGIKLPFLVMIVKNLKRYFSFEITVLDDKNMRRRFRISNFQSTTKIKPFCTTMPIGLAAGWNQIQFNLADFTRRAYNTQFVETLRVQIHANARLRRIYFCEKLYTEEELPQDYKLYLPLEKKKKPKPKPETKEAPTVKSTKKPLKEQDETVQEIKAAPAPTTPTPVPEEATTEEKGEGETEAEGMVEAETLTDNDTEIKSIATEEQGPIENEATEDTAKESEPEQEPAVAEAEAGDAPDAEAAEE